MFCLVIKWRFIVKQFQFQAFRQQRNDVFFACVLAAMFVVSVAGAVVGSVEMARGQASADVAKAQAPAVGDFAGATQVAQAGASK